MGITYDKGRYKLHIDAQGFTESKEKKTPFFFLEGTPVEKLEDDGTWYQTEWKYTRTIKLWLTSKTIDQTTEQLRTLGWTGTQLSSLEPTRAGHHSFVGLEVEVECNIDHYGDKEYENWQFPFEGGNRLESDPKVAQKLDALFGKSIKPINGSKKTPTTKELAEAKQAASVGAETDEDLPF